MNIQQEQKKLFSIGIVLCLFGGSFIIWNRLVVESFFYLIGALILLTSMLQLISVPFKKIPHKVNRSMEWGHACMTIVFGVFVLNLRTATATFIAWIVIGYLLIVGVIQLIDYILLQRNHVSGRFKVLFRALMHIFFAVESYVNKLASGGDIYEWIGWYILLLGVSTLQDSRVLQSKTLHKNGKRGFRMSLPIFMTGIVPVSILNGVNSFLSDEESKEVEWGYKEKGDENPELEVWIHTARKGFEMMGHVDISYKGLTYSFGHYDVETTKLFGLVGDGVLWTIPSHQYKESLADEDWRAVFCYGLKLTEEQQQIVEQQLDSLMQKTIPFELTTQQQKESYLGKLSQTYDVQSYKFTKSRFKTYFVMTTNCVLLADEIIGKTGIDRMSRKGIITPGAYQMYFEREYQRLYSNVVTKSVQARATHDEENTVAPST